MRGNPTSPTPPSHPKGEAEVMEEMFSILNTPYTFPSVAIEVAKSLRDYAEAALTTAAYTEHTSITLGDDPVQVSNARTPFPCLPDPAVRPLTLCHSHSRIISRLSRTLRRWPLLSSLANWGPDNGPSDPCHNAPDIPMPPGPHRTSLARDLADTRLAIVEPQPSA
jgi:hypothetical protein